MKAKLIYVSTAIAAAVIVSALAFVLGTPPWKSRVPFLVQMKIGEWTGLHLHRFPEGYTGKVQTWDMRGRLTSEENWKDGRRHGLFIRFNASGARLSISEYRNDEPWDGICYIYFWKGWTGEYRQGKPWNGWMPVNDHQEQASKWKYFIDGQEMSEADYKNRKQIPDNVQ